MLVLTRQTNQTIVIGEDIEITIVSVRGDKVRLGINAPQAVPVYRKELYLAIKQANIEAAAAGVEDLAKIPALPLKGGRKR